ncbi:MAG: M23 family metallopeptidase [Gammaproteobacteria bacterium]|nr:M23 family metallopeptidase [Gammaproteobacteria bacterium]
MCSLNLRKPFHFLALVLVMGGIIGGSAYLGQNLNPEKNNQVFVDQWQLEIHQQQVRLQHIQEESDANVDALSSRLGLLQAHVMRLDALGRKLINMASIDQGEFDFDNTPALGGPETVSQQVAQPVELSAAIERLKLELEDRENQLLVLENLVMNENLQKEVQPSGRPIMQGWLSSYYGMRTHPISGRKEMHKGIDFASKMGGDVIAVAKGVVTYAGKRYGYGQVIDIAHGNGYTTRYAHNSKLLVSVGDTVEKGFQIAEIGSSGRSTGPHVHFEVLKNGRQINPMKFIHASN